MPKKTKKKKFSPKLTRQLHELVDQLLNMLQDEADSSIDAMLAQLAKIDEFKQQHRVPKNIVADALDKRKAVKLTQYEYQLTALMMAARSGLLLVVSHLLDVGVNVNARSYMNNSTALSFACEGAHTDVATKLIDHPDIDLTAGEGGYDAAYYALVGAMKTGRTDILDLIKSKVQSQSLAQSWHKFKANNLNGDYSDKTLLIPVEKGIGAFGEHTEKTLNWLLDNEVIGVCEYLSILLDNSAQCKDSGRISTMIAKLTDDEYALISKRFANACARVDSVMSNACRPEQLEAAQVWYKALVKDSQSRVHLFTDFVTLSMKTLNYSSGPHFSTFVQDADGLPPFPWQTNELVSLLHKLSTNAWFNEWSKMLIDKGVSLTQTTGLGSFNLFHTMCLGYEVNIKLAQHLLDTRPEQSVALLETPSTQGYIPVVEFATELGSYDASCTQEIVRFFATWLNKGGHVDAVGNDEFAKITPLIAAARFHLPRAVITTLLDGGANPDVLPDIIEGWMGFRCSVRRDDIVRLAPIVLAGADRSRETTGESFDTFMLKHAKDETASWPSYLQEQLAQRQWAIVHELQATVANLTALVNRLDGAKQQAAQQDRPVGVSSSSTMFRGAKGPGKSAQDEVTRATFDC